MTGIGAGGGASSRRRHARHGFSRLRVGENGASAFSAMGSRLVRITRNPCWTRDLQSADPWISTDFDGLVEELLVGLVRAGEFERVGDRGLPLFHAGDDVGAAETWGLAENG